MYKEVGGIFETNPKKTPFAHANKLYLGYCSSDAWSGNAGPTPETFGLFFRGQRIVEAALKYLVVEHGLGSSSSGAQRMLFGGCSAGARGASFTLDYVPSILERAGAAPGKVEVRGLLDSSLWINYPPYGAPVVISLMCQTQAISTFINATGRYGDACRALYPDASESWKCLFGQYRMPTLTTPYALNEAQFDSFQIDYDMGGSNPQSPGQVAFALGFGQAMAAQVKALPTPAQTGSGVFSSACLHHWRALACLPPCAPPPPPSLPSPGACCCGV